MSQGRIRRGQGDHLGGASQISRGVYIQQSAKPGPRGKMSRTHSEPMADPKATGSKVAHVGTHGAPTIYTESYQGRKGGKGKRV